MSNRGKYAADTFRAVCSPDAPDIAGAGESPSAAQLAFFESKIRPVLVEHCYECHSATAKQIRGGLVVDSREGLLKGGDSGPSLVPGKPDESLLLAALKYEDFQMPPKGKLPPEVLQNFELWIREGAADPRKGSAAPAAKTIDIAEGRKFWSFQPVQNPPLPNIADARWAQCGIDAFVEAKRVRLASLPRPGPTAGH